MVLRTLHCCCFKLLQIMRNAAAPGFASFASCADRALPWWGACSPLLTEQFSAYLPGHWPGQGSWKEESAPSSLLSNILLLSCTTVLTGQDAASKVAG